MERFKRLYTLLETAPRLSEDDSRAKKAERIAACASLSEALCSKQNKGGEDYNRLLQITIEGLLIACADIDSDVRLQADECLNRTIKNLMEAHLPYLQVALLKVIKKEDAQPKSLRTALNKFAELSHLVKPTKRSAFVKTFQPHLKRILKDPNDSVQETAAQCMSKIFEALGLFFEDEDIQELLNALLHNMTSSSPTIRRAASDAAIAVCRHSRNPLKHIQQLTNSLFSLFQDSAEGDDKRRDHATLGKLLAFRKVMITHQQVSKEWGSSNHLLDEPLLERLFELLFDCLDRRNHHNIVTSALETLQQLLSVLRRELLSWYRNPERSVPLLKKLAAFLRKGSKQRVSVTALAISCLGQMLAYEPSFFRAFVVEQAEAVPPSKDKQSDTTPTPTTTTISTGTTSTTSTVSPASSSSGSAEKSADSTAVEVPLASLIFRFQFHSDPLLRGNFYTATAILLKASLTRKHLVFDHVPRPAEASSAFRFDTCDDNYALTSLCSRLIEGLNDPISTVVRSVMLGLRDCLPSLLRSTLGALGVEILQYLFALRFTSYWLLKVELADMIGEIDFVLVHYLEQEKRVPPAVLARLPTTALSFPMRNQPLSRFTSRVQPMALDTLMQLLGDADHRVRAKAAKAFVRLTALLFFEEDWPGQDPLAAVVERRAAYLAGVATSVSWFGGDGEGNFNRETHLDVPRANLSRIIDMLVQQLRTTQSKHAQAGCYHALHVLTSSTELPMEVRYTPASNSMGNPAMYVGDILPLALYHLTLSTVLTDTALHVDIMALVAAIVRRADRAFMEPYFHDLLGHVLCILNICVHVVEGRAPNPRESRPERRRATATSYPHHHHHHHHHHGTQHSQQQHAHSGKADTSSPRPRTATEVDISAASFTQSPSSSASSSAQGTSFADEFVARDGRIGAFAHLKHYMELYNLLNATFKASKITLKAEETSKFGDMVRVTLEVLASLVVVEGGAFQQMAQEVISYLQALMAAEPHNVLVCVHKLIVNLFGSPASHPKRKFGRSGQQQSSFQLLSLEQELDAIRPVQEAPDVSSGFFERCIGVTRTHLSDTQLRMSRADTIRNAKPPTTSSPSMAERTTGRNRNISPSRASGASNRERMLHFVRQIEPLVLKAMNSYTSTSSIPLQQQIIWLLCRLMSLKVTYTVLDSNQVLLRCLLKQIELIKNGSVRSAQMLLPYVFQFFLLLVNEKGVGLTMGSVLKMASEIIQSPNLKPQETLSAFKPFIRYFFVEQAQSYRPATSELLESQEMVVATLMKRLADPAVQDQATILLRAVRGDPDQWKKYSRQFVDCMLPLLAQGATETRGVRALQTLHRFFESVAPQALRPSKILLRCMFDSILPNIKIPGYISSPDADRERHRSLYSWLPSVLAIMKVLRTTKETELLAGLQGVLTQDTDEERAHTLLDALFKVIILVGRHFTHPTTSRSEVLSQQFAQLLQFVYGLVDNCGLQPNSAIFRAAQGVAAETHEAIDTLMDLVIFSTPLIAVYWYQLYGRLSPARMTRPQEVFGCLRSAEDARHGYGVNFGRDIATRGAFLLLCERWTMQVSEFSSDEHLSAVSLLRGNKASWANLILRMHGETPVDQTISHLLRDPSAPHYAATVEAFDAIWGSLHKRRELSTVQQQMLDQQLASRLCKAPASLPLVEMIVRRVILHNKRTPFVCATADLLVRRSIDDIDLSDRSLASRLRNLIAPARARAPRTYKVVRAALRAEALGSEQQPRQSAGERAQAMVEGLLEREPAQSWWDLAYALVTTPAGQSHPISSVVHVLLSGTPEEFKSLLQLPEFDPRYLQPLIKGACDGLRSESHLVTCERQWFVRSDDPGASQQASTSSVAKLGQLIVILKRVILSRVKRLLARCEGRQHGDSKRDSASMGDDDATAAASTTGSTATVQPTPHPRRRVVLSRRGADLMRAAGALAELHTQASGLRAIWQWQLVRDMGTDELQDLNDEVRAALDVLPDQALLLAQAATAAVEEINARMHACTTTPLPLWPVTVVLGAVVKILEHPGVKTHLVRERDDDVTPLGVQLISRTVDVAYDMFRYTTLSRLPPHPRDPVSRLRLQEMLDDGYGSGYGGGDDGEEEEKEKDSERAARKRMAGLSLVTLHRLGLLTKEAHNMLSPRAVGRLLNHFGGKDETLPLFFRLTLNSVVRNVAPLVMTSMQLYALCCNPETCKPSSRIVSFVESLLKSDGVDMRRELLQDDLVAEGLAQRVRIIGFRNTSEEALGLLWTWLRDMVELRDDQPTREARETTTVLAVRALAGVLSMIDPRAHSSVFPPYLEVENTLSSYLETVAGLYLHRVHLMQRFDYLATHGDTWRRIGRCMTDISPEDTAKSVSEFRRCVEKGIGTDGQYHKFMIYLPQVIEMCLALVETDAQAVKILNVACETLHVLLDRLYDAEQLTDISVRLFDLAASDLIADDHIVLRSVLPVLCKLQAMQHDGEQRRLDIISNMLHTGFSSQLPSVRMAAITGIKYLAQGQIGLVALPFVDHVREAVQVLTKHALLEQSKLSTTTTAWVPRLFWSRAFDAAIQLIMSFPEEADKASLTYNLTADLSSMCLAPSNLSEGSYSRSLSSLVRLVLSFVLDSRETDALLTLAGNVHNRSGIFSLLDVSEVICATALLYSKDNFLIHDQLDDASPLTVVERSPLNFGDRLSRMMEAVVDEVSALVLARSLSFMLTDFWPARQVLQTVMGQWTGQQGATPVTVDARSRLIAHAHVTYHVFARMLSLGFGQAAAEWVCLSLPNVLRERHWREACICLFSAVCGDARQRSLLFLALGQTTSATGVTASPPVPEPGDAEDGSSSGDDSQGSGLCLDANGEIDLDYVFLMAGLMFYNSDLLSEQSVNLFLNVCSSSTFPLCHALVTGCLACKTSEA